MSPATVFPLLCAPLFAVLGVTALAKSLRRVGETTLVPAWVAAAIALAAWEAALVLAPGHFLPAELHGRLWYAAAILALCPAVAVLGARKPIARLWTWFVLLPLVAVLSLPLMASSWKYGAAAAMQVELPIALGFLLVLLMGAGNYLGTRFTLAALLYGIAVAVVASPCTAAGAAAGWSTDVCGPLGTAMLALSCWAAVSSARKAHPPELPDYDRLWLDFRDTFGIVWAKRVLERINWTAAEEKWPAELGFQGLIWTKPDLTDAERAHVIARLKHIDRWLLKRFVDETWIESRIG